MFKAVFFFAVLLLGSNAFACRSTPMGASTMMLGAVLKHVNEQYSSHSHSVIKNITTVTSNRFVVTVVDASTGELTGEHKYLVDIGPNCSTKVRETGP